MPASDSNFWMIKSIDCYRHKITVLEDLLPYLFGCIDQCIRVLTTDRPDNTDKSNYPFKLRILTRRARSSVMPFFASSATNI